MSPNNSSSSAATPKPTAGLIREFFSSDGPLAQVLEHYEQREEQVRIAEGVFDAIERRTSLIAEAGTGTGKTLAYLAPALASGLRVVISTGTKNLQDQIIHNDMPLLEEATGKQFDVQLMKGRSNYFCHLRAERFLATPKNLSLLESTEPLQESIVTWQQETETGDLAELHNLPERTSIWSELSATSDQCLGRKCADYERCWVTHMRRQAQTAQLIVVNHHLYFADAKLKKQVGSQQQTLIPPHDIVIFDEAHELDEVVSHHFCIELSESRVVSLCRDVIRTLKQYDSDDTLLDQLSVQLEIAIRHLFDKLPFRTQDTRLRERHLTLEIHRDVERLDELLQSISQQLGLGEHEEFSQLRVRAEMLQHDVAFLLSAQNPHAASQNSPTEPNPQPADVPYVRYTHTSRMSRSLTARPVTVASIMRDVLQDMPCIYASATLTVDGSFTHYAQRIGVHDISTTTVDSPFDFNQQMRLFLPKDLPPPNDPHFPHEAADRVLELVSASQGGAFVLCTSHKMLSHMTQFLREYSPLQILAQREAPKRHLLQAFEADGNAVLVATMSFWQGVDVPGHALRLIIIDKIPFASPDDPITAAKIEYHQQLGQSGFSSYQIPQAAILLRQGVGRLLRRRTDTGLVSILDSRVSQRGYGKVLLRSLPRCPTIDDPQEAIDYLSSNKALQIES